MGVGEGLRGPPGIDVPPYPSTIIKWNEPPRVTAGVPTEGSSVISWATGVSGQSGT